MNNGVLKLMAIACDRGINVYEQKSRIIVIPPKIALKQSKLKLLFFGVNKSFFNKRKKHNIITLIKFLKNACSIGWIIAEINFINPAKTEKKKHDVIINIIGYID